MKKYLLIILTATFCFSQSSFAQDDDVYFIPSKSDKAKEKNTDMKSEYSLYDDDAYEYDNWAENRSNNSRDVDEYNRRKTSADQQKRVSTEYEADYADETANGSCTSRIVRFHSPSLGVYVSSPFYSDYIDVWFDPWYYDPWYGGYTYVGWNSWYHSSFYWNSYWYDPWYYPFGPHYSWYYPHYYPHYRPIPYGANRGPHGGYVHYSHRNNGSSGNRYYAGNRYSNGNRPSRHFGNYNNERPSRDFGNNSGRPSKEIGHGNNNRPSRKFGNSSNRQFGNGNRSEREHNTSTPSRSFNTSPSRSNDRNFGSGHSNRGGFGGGHSRSGGGRNFGGRR